MKKTVLFKGTYQTLKAMNSQARGGVKFCAHHFGSQTPLELFSHLKRVTTYTADPENIELVHGPRSLFQDNYHGKPGAGDCDDLATLARACFLAQGLKNYFVIGGDSPEGWGHVWNAVHVGNGLYKPFDLVHDRYGCVFPFKYVRVVDPDTLQTVNGLPWKF